MKDLPFKYRKLDYEYDLFFDIKSGDQLKDEIDRLVTRLSDIADMCRRDGYPVDDYVLSRLGLGK